MLFAGFATLVALTLEPMREFGLRDWLLYDDSYRDIAEPTWWAALLRLGFIAVAIVLSAAFFSLIPRRGTWFTVLGAGTMYVYLLHSFVLYPLRETGFLAERTEPLWVLATIVFAFLARGRARDPPVRRMFRPLVQPRLNWLFHPACTGTRVHRRRDRGSAVTAAGQGDRQTQRGSARFGQARTPARTPRRRTLR